MWNRVELKEDSKSLLRLNYWPFVLVALVHMIAVGSGFRRNNGARASKEWYRFFASVLGISSGNSIRNVDHYDCAENFCAGTG